MLAIIPARAGSKGLPSKNKKMFCGKPLIQHSVEAALASTAITRLIVSTDDLDIIRLLGDYEGVEIPFVRPRYLSEDQSIVTDAIFHVIDWIKKNEGLELTNFCVLQPTSPLRLPEDIDGAVTTFFSKKASVVLTMCEAKSASWHYYLSEDFRLQPHNSDHQYGNPMYARQQQKKYFVQNGAVHVFDTEHLKSTGSYYGNNTYAYIMPTIRSIDIDDITDFQIAELIMERGLHQRK